MEYFGIKKEKEIRNNKKPYKREDIEEAIKRMGDFAMEEARNIGNPDASIVYIKDWKMIREYIDGRIEEINGNRCSEKRTAHNSSL